MVPKHRSTTKKTRALKTYVKLMRAAESITSRVHKHLASVGLTISQFGVLRGILLTSDRLQRCNSMSISRYQRDHKSGRLVDPVRIYAEIIR